MSFALIASWEWDITGDAITWSQEACRVLGLAPARTPTVLAQYLALVHPDDHEAVAGAVRHTLETGVSFELDHRIVLPEGSIRFLRCRGALVTDAVGRPVSMRGTVVGITERRCESILLVDDQDEIRSLIRRILEARGYHVLVAASGDDALRLTVQYTGTIDLLVTDVVMPGLSGLEVALLLAPAHPKMRVLYLSGYPLERGDAFLQKPFTAEALARKVREVLDAS